MPAYLNSINNLILRTNLPADKDPRQYGKLGDTIMYNQKQQYNGTAGLIDGEVHLFLFVILG